ncbi:MAG: ribbon-helix-helix domain-containing protein [Pseudolabrys sp.]
MLRRLMDQVGHIRKTTVIKRSIFINSHKTSVSLENEFWLGLREIADHERTTVPILIEEIDHSRDNCNLSSAIRVFVFNHLRREKLNGNLKRRPIRPDLSWP